MRVVVPSSTAETKAVQRRIKDIHLMRRKPFYSRLWENLTVTVAVLRSRRLKAVSLVVTYTRAEKTNGNENVDQRFVSRMNSPRLADSQEAESTTWKR